MKYGVIVTTPMRSKKEKFINIGDEFQAIAILRIYKEMRIKEDEIIFIDFNDLMEYDGEYVLLPICMNWQLDYGLIPLPPRIIPCFIGLSLFMQDKLPVNVLSYLRKFEPIGCRDEQTLNSLRNYDIDVYLAGCVTATLEKRKDDRNRNIIYCVDLSDEVIEKIPAFVKKNHQIKKYSHIFNDDGCGDYSYNMHLGEQLLNEYRDNACLVITSRLHALSPCMAMGIPVIGLFSNISPRMAWIDRLVKLYTVENMEYIDWNGHIVDYEDIKIKMKNNIIKRIEQTKRKYSDLLDVSYFFENREKALYGSRYYIKAKELPKERFKYIIWGGGQIAIQLVEVLKDCCPQGELIGVIDSYAYGKSFKGLTMEKPEAVQEEYMDILCINATYSGRDFVSKYMKKINKNSWVDFSSVNG